MRQYLSFTTTTFVAQIWTTQKNPNSPQSCSFTHNQRWDDQRGLHIYERLNTHTRNGRHTIFQHIYNTHFLYTLCFYRGRSKPGSKTQGQMGIKRAHTNFGKGDNYLKPGPWLMIITFFSVTIFSHYDTKKEITTHTLDELLSKKHFQHLIFVPRQRSL